MAITTQNQLLANLLPPIFFHKAGQATSALTRIINMNMMPGIPGQISTTISPGTSGAAVTSLDGQLAFPAPVAGKNVYIARFAANSTGQGGVLVLADRLWHNSGTPTNIAFPSQSIINSVPWPQRDVDGALDGRGVYVGVEFVTANTNAGAHQLYYTNSAGVPDRMAYMSNALASSAVGSVFLFNLAEGDVGVKYINFVQWGGTAIGGTVRFFAYRPLLVLPMPSANQTYLFDATKSGLIRCWDNTVPFMMFFPSGTGQSFLTGSITYAQG